MPNMEDLISRISRKIADGPADEIWISKFDLDYAYGQLKPSRRAMDLCMFAVTGGNFTNITSSQKVSRGWQTSPQFFKKKLTKHWKTNTQRG